MNTKRICQWVLGLGLLSAFLLSLAHLYDLCTSACTEGHQWHLFGMPFEIGGMIYFTLLGLLFLFNRTFWLGTLLVAGLGAEIYFIIIQATKMSAFCHLCLGVAASLAISTIAYFWGRFYTMKNVYLSLPVLVLGFLAAFIGVVKVDKLAAAQESIKESLAFGKKQTPIEVYLFTDWACPACRKLEPELKKIVPAIESNATFFYVDHAVHPETMNFIPYNLSFLINNKNKYLQIRDVLSKISEKTSAPNEAEIEAAVAKLGVKYKQLNYADVAMGIKFFKELGQKYKVIGTPTLVVINTETKKGKRLVGTDEITAKDAIAAINALKNGSSK